MSRRLVTLLAEFPEHPVLAQLMAIASRCLGLPAASTPLKTALTGLELLLARAQRERERAEAALKRMWRLFRALKARSHCAPGLAVTLHFQWTSTAALAGAGSAGFPHLGACMSPASQAC
eukprot:scaffold135361_cov16-Tisochrysis_lutea.AAC.2